MSQAWVTLATNDDYAIGALVLGQSLRSVNTCNNLHIIITSGVTDAIRKHLLIVFDEVTKVDEPSGNEKRNLPMMQRPDLALAFLKFQCWRLMQYSKCVFVDADCLVLKNCDELFDYEGFSAAPDQRWPDIFNTGIFVFSPSDETYDRLMAFTEIHGSNRGGDQAILNEFFKDWMHSQTLRLPFIYNASSSTSYTYTSAFKRFSHEIKIVHFLGQTKPWHYKYNIVSGGVSAQRGGSFDWEHVRLWWDTFVRNIMPLLFDVPKQMLNVTHAECPQEPVSYFYNPPSRREHVEPKPCELSPCGYYQPQPVHSQLLPTDEKALYAMQMAINSSPSPMSQQQPQWRMPHTRPPFVACVAFNMEPPPYTDREKIWSMPPSAYSKKFGQAPCMPLEPPQVPYIEQPWQPPKLPGFVGGELPAVDRPQSTHPPPLWPPSLVSVAHGLASHDPEASVLLAELIGALPNELINRPLIQTHFPCEQYSNRLTECPQCGESLAYLSDYFPSAPSEEERPLVVTQTQKSTPVYEEAVDNEDYGHRLAWEQGMVDYKGRDSWDKIMGYLTRNLE